MITCAKCLKEKPVEEISSDYLWNWCGICKDCVLEVYKVADEDIQMDGLPTEV